MAINNLGQVVGTYADSNYYTDGYVHGYLYTPGSNGGYKGP